MKKDFSKEIEELLNLKADLEERELLESLGIKIKNPTKQTALAATLYKKALSGESSALKEVLACLKGAPSESEGVILIDDTEAKNQ